MTTNLGDCQSFRNYSPDYNPQDFRLSIPQKSISYEENTATSFHSLCSATQFYIMYKCCGNFTRQKTCDTDVGQIFRVSLLAKDFLTEKTNGSDILIHSLIRISKIFYTRRVPFANSRLLIYILCLISILSKSWFGQMLYIFNNED